MSLSLLRIELYDCMRYPDQIDLSVVVLTESLFGDLNERLQTQGCKSYN
jgi:hypothetical protein